MLAALSGLRDVGLVEVTAAMAPIARAVSWHGHSAGGGSAFQRFRRWDSCNEYLHPPKALFYLGLRLRVPKTHSTLPASDSICSDIC